jgi:hypothetical protein
VFGFNQISTFLIAFHSKLYQISQKSILWDLSRRMDTHNQTHTHILQCTCTYLTTAAAILACHKQMLKRIQILYDNYLLNSVPCYFMFLKLQCGPHCEGRTATFCYIAVVKKCPDTNSDLRCQASSAAIRTTHYDTTFLDKACNSGLILLQNCIRKIHEPLRIGI